MRKAAIILVVLFTATIAGCEGQQVPEGAPNNVSPGEPDLPPPGKTVVGEKPPMPEPVRRPRPEEYSVETFVSGLVVPWDMAFASKDRVYVTERPGRVRLIENGKLREEPYARIEVIAEGEGGLMGIALHPRYPDPSYVYLMYTARDGNRISRFTDTGSGLADEKPLVKSIPSASVHNGGIIRFGPDGMLYAGTGDTFERELAQDKSSLAGKILRMTPEGDRPADNPFPNSLVYALGLRNVQGLAWNPKNGDLWATMHGPSGEGGLQAKDAVFIVPKGGNCGWPRVIGVTDRRGVVDPVLFFPDVAMPPALAAFYNADLMPELRGNFFFASLRGEHLQRVILSGTGTISRIERWFETGTHEGVYGRLRAVVVGPDGALYVSTSNRDNRGSVRPGDDRILRISPK
ncbi:MAG: PQQ-dependent sugar dehydrogenase [Armatimonadetes bacterium]|nr:PQQ-dependent sugar dehydrogenase [Armatimonadota bacterium]